MEEGEASRNRTLDDLPEELLLRILTFLPTLESVQTSLISQKWQPLWSRVPALNFRYELFPPYEPPLDTRHFFADFIDRVLISRSNSPNHTFRLSFIYLDHYASHVDSWVRSAVTHLHARELHLDFLFHDIETLDQRYDFPFSVLRNGSVEILSLSGCDVTLPAQMPTMRFYSIRSVFLSRVHLADQTMPDLIAGCPNLESLELLGYWGNHRLKICSTRLKKLVLGYSEIKGMIFVDCPNLCSISFQWGDFHKIVLKNASSLVEFHVNVPHIIDRSYRHWSEVVKLLGQAPNVRRLKVQNWWFKFLTSKDCFPKSFMLHNLNLLELQTKFSQYDLVGMAALLKLCPNLETMILGGLFTMDKDETLSEELLDKPVDFSIPSLKQVTVKVYTGRQDEANFVKMLIQQGVVLEKIVLFPVQYENGQVFFLTNEKIFTKVQVGERSLPPLVLHRKASESWKYSLLRNTK